MNTKRTAADKNSSSIEKIARRGSADFLYGGIHTFKFIDHSTKDGKDLTMPFATGGMEAVITNDVRIQPATDGPEDASK